MSEKSYEVDRFEMVHVPEHQWIAIGEEKASLHAQLGEANERIEALEGENTVLREMGQFYADENHHVRPTIPGKVYYGRDAEPSVVDVDRGQKAREALGK